MDGMEIYYTPECHACKELKEILTERGMPFKAIDYSQLTKPEKDIILQIAKSNRQMAFPIVFMDDTFIHTTEVYNMLGI